MKKNAYFVCASRHIRTLTLITVIGSILLPSVNAQEFLNLPDLSVKLAQPAADGGDAEAPYILASVYFKGKRVPRDYHKVEALLTRAAEQGLALAQLHLGDMYYNGTRIPQNDAAALHWYQVAALQGLPQAQYGLAKIYEEGRGTTKNDEEARRWYEQAAMQGHAMAQFEVGLLYATGTGVASDPLTGYMWLALSAAQDNPQAVTGRDNVRDLLTPEQLTIAQRNAGLFKATPHYNTEELTRQSKRITDRAEAIIGVKK